MIKNIQILFITSLILWFYSTKTKTYPIIGSVQQSFSYCGGAKPTQEIIDNFAKLQPFKNKTFFIKKGKINSINNKIVAKFTTDSLGNFSIKLPKGTYSILVEEQIKEIKAEDYNTKFQTINNECLQKWWKKPYYLLIVKKKNIPLKFIFNHRCYINSDIPCITYIGPRHP